MVRGDQATARTGAARRPVRATGLAGLSSQAISRRQQGEVHDEPTSTQDLRFDQAARTAPRLGPMLRAIEADRNATQVQPHGLSCFLDSQPRTTPRHAAPREVRRHRGAMCAVPICQLLDGRAIEVVTDKPVDLGGGEKGLKMFNPPNQGAPRVLHRGGLPGAGTPGRRPSSTV